MTWAHIKQRIRALGLDPEKKYFGVPKGGQPIAAFLNPVDTPEEADIIIDDLVDSGQTRDQYHKAYPDKPFVALFEKGSNWLIFPWEQKEAPASDAVVRLLERIGEDPDRPGLKDTPRRYLNFLDQVTRKDDDWKMTTFDAEGYDEMIVQKDIQFYSLCEHHLAPFFGVAHVGYIPNQRIVGLSKLSRCVEYAASGLQNQERLTSQVQEILTSALNPQGVAVVVKAQHLCMSMRGVKNPANTTTSRMTGEFRNDKICRSEFLNFIK